MEEIDHYLIIIIDRWIRMQKKDIQKRNVIKIHSYRNRSIESDLHILRITKNMIFTFSFAFIGSYHNSHTYLTLSLLWMLLWLLRYLSLRIIIWWSWQFGNNWATRKSTEHSCERDSPMFGSLASTHTLFYFQFSPITKSSH